jgi:hypothetical protein
VTATNQFARRAGVLATKYAPLFSTSIGVVLIHYEQCSWGPESAKRPTTKQYVDSLKRMNLQLNQRNRFLEARLALYTSRPVDERVRSADLALRISDRASPSSLGGPSSPASTQSEPVFTKTEEQDDIDQIIAPTRHLHVRIVLS